MRPHYTKSDERCVQIVIDDTVKENEPAKQKPQREITHSIIEESPNDQHRPLSHDDTQKKADPGQTEYQPRPKSFLEIGRAPRTKWKRQSF